MVMRKKILHIAGCDKFIPPFIEFIEEHFDYNDHEFLLTNGMAAQELKKNVNVSLAKRTIIGRLKYYFQAIIKMHQAKKVILHGLFDIKLVYLLFLMPWLLKKCYWVMWGGDLYVYQLGERDWKWKLREFFRRPVIKNMGHLVAYIKGEYELAQLWYSAKGQHHKCFMYTSNLYKEYDVPQKQHKGINILVGNSADPSNNHLEVFDKLEDFKDQDIKIFSPLSYGNSDYAKRVIDQGKQRFGDKFEGFTEHMPFNQYLEFLGKIDIAIFNHKRQQAMGNIRTLLGLGKKVYMRNDITSFQALKDDGIKVFSIDEVDTDSKFDEKVNNIEKTRNIYSEKNLISCLDKIFKEAL